VRARAAEASGREGRWQARIGLARIGPIGRAPLPTWRLTGPPGRHAAPAVKSRSHKHIFPQKAARSALVPAVLRS
jgi:hypothetical protein